MPDEAEPREPDGNEVSTTGDAGDPSRLDDDRALAAINDGVPDLDARERRVGTQRKAAGPPLMSPGSEGRTADVEQLPSANDVQPTDPA